VRVIEVDSRRMYESESELGHRVHWAVWKRSGRAWPLGDTTEELDSNSAGYIVVAGPWTAWVGSSCSHETEECAWVANRLDAQTGRSEQNDTELNSFEHPAQPGSGCQIFDSGSKSITALVLAGSGTIAWIQGTDVCELPHDAQREPGLSAPGFERQRIPVLLASAPAIAPDSLRRARGRVYWSEEIVHSAPLP
jgi:hypothetical protein